jgi:hypothetical protein
LLNDNQHPFIHKANVVILDVRDVAALLSQTIRFNG